MKRVFQKTHMNIWFTENFKVITQDETITGSISEKVDYDMWVSPTVGLIKGTQNLTAKASAEGESESINVQMDMELVSM